MGSAGGAARLRPYVARRAIEWDLDAPGADWQVVDATCCFVDISGFTALSERLAARGRRGAEELTGVLSRVFSRMLGVARERGGSLLKFGGDALLVVFTEGDHALSAVSAAVGMRSALREESGRTTSAGRVRLRMSAGVHSGSLHMFLAGCSHRELLVTGPSATATTRMEQIAGPGEIVLSASTASRLPSGATAAARGEGWLLGWRRGRGSPSEPSPPRPTDPGLAEAYVPESLRRRLAEGEGEAEHRTACVAFLRFEGVDGLLSVQGPGAVAGVLSGLVCAVQDAAARESVTFLASDVDADGGKILLATGVPAAQEDDEGRLLRALRSVLDRPSPLVLRAGVNRGHVFVGDVGAEDLRTFTVMGDTVNLAARLLAHAPPGGLLATGPVLERARTAFGTDSLEPFSVKGKSAPVHAYRVGAPTGRRQERRLGSLPFTGREAEVGLLVEALSRARARRGSVVVVEGERGQGKSRLLDELEARAGELAVLRFAGEPSAGALPYQAARGAMRAVLGIGKARRDEAGKELLAALTRLGGRLAPFAPLLAPIVDAEVAPTPESGAVAPEFARDRIAGLVVEVLEAAVPGPLILIAEDAHWFDDATSGICSHLARAATYRPWLLCVARRPGAGGFDPEPAGARIELGPLADRELVALVESATEAAPLRPHERDRLVRRCGGNPLFLEELLRAARGGDVGALPDSLDAVATREIDMLPRPCRRVLRIASVLGPSFELPTLARLLAEEGVEPGDDPLAGLEHQLGRDGTGRLGFRHAVLRDAAYESLPFRSRLELHRRVALALERRGEAEPAAAELSYHCLAAQDWERTWRYSRLAARRAREAHAQGDAASELERAAAAGRRLPGVAEEGLAEVLAELGEVRTLLGEYELADDAFRRAASARRDDPLWRASLAERRAYLLSEHLGRPAAALRVARAARAALGPLEAGGEEVGRLRARLLAREADVRMRQGRLTDAISTGEAAVAAAEIAGSKPALALALSVLDGSLFQAGRGVEATHMEQVLALYEELDDHLHVAIALGNLAATAYFAGRWDLALERWRRSAAVSEEAGDLAGAAIAELNLGEVRVNQGRLDAAVAHLRPARRTLESYGYRVMAALAAMQLGRALAFLGEREAGLELVEGAAATFDEIGARLESLEARARHAEVLAHAGRFAEAAASLRSARQLELHVGESSHAALLDRVALTIAAGRGDRSRFAAGLEQCLERALGLGADYDVLVVLALAEATGDSRRAAERARLETRLGVVRLAPLPQVTGAGLSQAGMPFVRLGPAGPSRGGTG